MVSQNSPATTFLTSVVIDNNDDVRLAVIFERLVKVDGVPLPGIELHLTTEHTVFFCHHVPAGIRTAGLSDIDSEIARQVALRGIEGKAPNLSLVIYLLSGVQLLAQHSSMAGTERNFRSEIIIANGHHCWF